MAKIEFFGLAMSWDIFTPQSGRRARFGRHAFDRFVSRTESSYLRLWVNHLDNLQLTRAGQILWSTDHNGLWCRFSIERATALDRAVCTAIEYGWLPGLSIHYDNNMPTIQMSDDDGSYVLINDCGFMRELSVVDAPGCKAAFAERADGTSQTPRTFPTDPLERSRLVSLLNDLGIDHEKPTAVIVNPAEPKTTVPSRTTSTAKTISEPIFHLAAIRKAQESHPPAGTKTTLKSTGNWIADMHNEWCFKYRYDEWLKMQNAIKRSPTRKITLIAD